MSKIESLNDLVCCKRRGERFLVRNNARTSIQEVMLKQTTYTEYADNDVHQKYHSNLCYLKYTLYIILLGGLPKKQLI